MIDSRVDTETILEPRAAFPPNLFANITDNAAAGALAATVHAISGMPVIPSNHKTPKETAGASIRRKKVGQYIFLSVNTFKMPKVDRL